MVRKLLFVVATCAGLLGPGAVTAQAEGPVVVVDGRPTGVTTAPRGTLAPSATSGPAGFLSVYGGLSVLALTLAGITRQRRSALRSAGPDLAGAGVAYGPRSHADFWAPHDGERSTVAATPPSPRVVGPAVRRGASSRDLRPTRPKAGVAAVHGSQAPAEHRSVPGQPPRVSGTGASAR